MFKMKNEGSGLFRIDTPLMQQNTNVSTNEAYEETSDGGYRKIIIITTPERIIPGTPAPEPVVKRTPGRRSTFDPKGVKYEDDCRGIKSGPGRTGTFNCDPPDPDPIIVPPSEEVITGQGTPDQIIPGTTSTDTEVFRRPEVAPPPTLGSITAGQGSGKSGFGNINLPSINIKAPDLNRFIPEVSFRGVRNLLKGCKGGGCPKY
jgi:hypothetical protein